MSVIFYGDAKQWSLRSNSPHFREAWMIFMRERGATSITTPDGVALMGFVPR